MRHFNAGKKIDYRKFAVFVFRPGAETYPLPFQKPGGRGGEAVIRLSGHRTGRIAAYL